MNNDINLNKIKEKDYKHTRDWSSRTSSRYVLNSSPHNQPNHDIELKPTILGFGVSPVGHRLAGIVVRRHSVVSAIQEKKK